MLTAAEPIDWAARWHALVEGREAQGAALLGGARPNADFWEKRADLFARFSAALPDDDAVLLRLRREVRPGDTVLDVGAGAGRYTVPLAGLSRQVVAVEPSPGMRAHLRQRLIEGNLDARVEVVAADWAAAAVAPADVVVCVHVHYAIANIVPFLRKLDAHARRLVVMVSRVGQFRGPADLWQEVHGAARIPEPSFIDLYNLLYQLGIVAEVQLLTFSARWAYADLDEAVAENRDRLLVTPHSLADARLRAALATRLQQGDDGLWHWPTPPVRAAILTWAPTTA
ncbi:MAG: methyltransferase domain-containing protein [Chloroflexi bacterium]|nr:methyltransferase domain-containing protein [Chloroflexota bacterium]